MKDGTNGSALRKYAEHEAEEGTSYLGKMPKKQHWVSRALPCSDEMLTMDVVSEEVFGIDKE